MNIKDEKMEDEDKMIRDFMASSGSSCQKIDNEPTIVSLQDTIDCVKRKFGENWKDIPEAEKIVVWASKAFIQEHVKEVCPDLYDLCEEYRNKGTYHGEEIPPGFVFYAFCLFSNDGWGEQKERWL